MLAFRFLLIWNTVYVPKLLSILQLGTCLLMSTIPFQLNMDILCAGKRAFIAGVADDNGYGWAIAKSLAAAGAEILVGTWVPVS